MSSVRWESFQKSLKFRRRIKELLHGASDGAFIIRESPCNPNVLQLCVKFKGDVLHYRIVWADVSTNDDNRWLDSLTNMINKHCFIQDEHGVRQKLTAMKRGVKRRRGHD